MIINNSLHNHTYCRYCQLKAFIHTRQPAGSLILPAMDRFDSLTNTLSNLTVYDIKNMYNQVRSN